ncbi:hypothetical protein PAXINDRAFT_21728, partial [Paxillus involutus ATCC 200175]
LPPPSPIHPERPVDVDTARTSKTPARRRADDVHDPDAQTKKPPSVRLEGESGRRSSLHVETDDLKMCKTAAQRMCADETVAPEDKPPSVRLEGERIRLTSPYVDIDDVEATTPDSKPPSVRLEGESGKQSSLNVKSTDDHDHDDQPTPRGPVGTPDGDSRRPNGPTEPPDEEKGARRGNGEMKVNRRVETVEEVETEESRRVDEPGDEEVEESRSKEVEGEIGDQSEEEGCQRDGRTNDTGDATSSASCNSSRVETDALADDEAGQQCNGKPRASTSSPGPSTPLPYASRRPTHQVNPPRRRGRLKSPPTNVSQPERTEYAPRRTVESTTTQANRTQRKRYRATGGVSRSHHHRGRRAPRPARRHRTPLTSPIPANYHIG